MALLVISKAISDGIKRNVATSELKHTARIDDLKLELATKSMLRLDHHSRKYAEATVAHATWHNGLSEPEQAIFAQCKAALQAAIAPVEPSK